jgi:hypothetical protein
MNRCIDFVFNFRKKVTYKVSLSPSVLILIGFSIKQSIRGSIRMLKWGEVTC